MFWRKSKAPEGAMSSVHLLAQRLGVERRMNVRVCYPPRTLASLPAIHFEGQALRVHDISVGGCCLIDTNEVLGPNVGHDLTLHLGFSNGNNTVHSRLVGSIHNRRHIQFLNLPMERVEYLKNQMVFGIRALDIKPGMQVGAQGPSLLANEIWSSPQGDALVIEESLQRLGQAEICGDLTYFYREADPTDRHGIAISGTKLNQIILFFANIGQSSPSIKKLLSHLESLALGENE